MSILTKTSMFFKNNKTVLLTGIAISGVVSTAVLAVKGTPLAITKIQSREEELDRILNKKEMVKETWKCYIPAAVSGGLTIGSILYLNNTHSKATAALAGLYTLSDKAFTEYKEEVKSLLGEKTDIKIRDAVRQKRIDKSDPGDIIIANADGNMLCYDEITGRYFKSDIEKIRRIINDVNARLIQDGEISLNDLYYELGLPCTKIGDSLIWRSDYSLIEASFSSLLTKDGVPCLVLGFNVDPIYYNLD